MYSQKRIIRYFFRKAYCKIFYPIRFGTAGFSLLEMMIAVGIGSLVLVGILNISSQMMNTSSNAFSNSELVQVQYEISTILSRSSLCKSALNGQSCVEGATVDLSMGDPTGIRVDSVFGNKIRITKLQLQNIQNLGGVNRKAEIALGAKRISSVGGGPEFYKDRTFNVYLKVDDTNNIIDCYGESTLEESCISFGGTFDAPSGKCNICESMGLSWDDVSKKCIFSSCSAPQYEILSGGSVSCSTCTSGQAYDSVLKRCVSCSSPDVIVMSGYIPTCTSSCPADTSYCAPLLSCVAVGGCSGTPTPTPTPSPTPTPTPPPGGGTCMISASVDHDEDTVSDCTRVMMGLTDGVRCSPTWTTGLVITTTEWDSVTSRGACVSAGDCSGSSFSLRRCDVVGGGPTPTPTPTPPCTDCRWRYMGLEDSGCTRDSSEIARCLALGGNRCDEAGIDNVCPTALCPGVRSYRYLCVRGGPRR